VATWLLKSEPEAYSFQALEKDGKTAWTGVRNYAARNHLRAMKVGDLGLFYHSNKGKEVVGIVKVVRTAYADPTATEGDWSAVDVAPVRPVAHPVTLEAMREHPKLRGMRMWKEGRLSVSPLSQAEFDAIVAASEQAPAGVKPKNTAPKPGAKTTKKTPKKKSR
jgi:predicted RNA-binding protein with PUA-like domain